MTTQTTEWPMHFRPDVVPRAPSSDALSSICIGLEAWRRGLKVTFRSGNLHFYTISDGDNDVRFNCALPTSITSREDAMRLRQKWVTNEILEAHGIPVPRSTLVSLTQTPIEEVRRDADNIGYPLVVKPNVGSVGRGVFVGLHSWDAVAESLTILKEMGTDDVVLQSQHYGDDVRVLVVGKKVVGAVKRIPANLVGDGTSTIRALIEVKNSVRRLNPFLSKGTIRVDLEVERCLDEQEMSLDSIPQAGKHIYLRKVANASAGGDVIDVTDVLPRRVKRAAIAAVQVMPNIVVSGVDVIYDPSSKKFVIIEMNRRPHIAVNMYPTYGTGRDVPKAFIDYFFPESKRREDVDHSLLRFDPAPIRRLLLTRSSDAVSLTPLPRDRFPFRRVYSFDQVDEDFSISARQEIMILRAAGARKISGRMESRDGRVEVSVAALRKSSVERLLDVVASILGVEVAESREWDGVITQGFHIDQSLVVETAPL